MNSKEMLINFEEAAIESEKNSTKKSRAVD